MREYEFHHFAEEYPLMPDEELGILEDSMRLHGYDTRFPIWIYQERILDGRNRYLACQRAKIEPYTRLFTGTEEEARAFVIRANEHRRHLAADWLERRRKERVDRTAQLRADGKSTRAIAQQTGVSESQVRNDLKAATAQGCAVEPPDGKVTGLDGRTRTATPAKPADPPPERQPGEDAPEPEAPKPPKNGRPTITLKEHVDPHYGALLRVVADVGRPFGQQNSVQAEALRENLEEWRAELKGWMAELRCQE
jgi:hypothetical protein